MDTKFIQRVENRIAEQRQAVEQMRRTAEQARQKGDWETFWTLTAPGNTGDLLTIVGKEQEAADYFRDAVQYFETYQSWMLTQNRQWTVTTLEADTYLKARLYDQARARYEMLCDMPTATDKSIHSIALVNSGDIERGRSYLDWRIKNLNFGDENSASRWYHLGECYFWKGDYANALPFLLRAVERWADKNPDPPVLALMLLTRFIINRAPADGNAAYTAFDASVRWFYHEGDTEHAFDAHEYMQLLQAVEQNRPLAGYRVRGISFLRV